MTHTTQQTVTPTKALRDLIEASESQTKRIRMMEQQFMDLCVRVNKIEDSKHKI